MTKEIYKRTVRVETIETKNINKENTDRDEYRLIGHDSEKLSKFIVTSPNPFQGINPGELIDVTISSSQTTIDEFKGTEEEDEE